VTVSEKAAARLAPPPPHALDESGRPRFGAYAGELFGADRLSLGAGLAGLLAAPLRRKRWVWLGIFSPRVIASFAVVDVGYLGQAFGAVFDREAAPGGPAEVEWLAPLGLGVGVRELLTDVRARARAPFRHIAVRGEGGSVRAFAALGPVAGEVRIERLDVPISVLTDMGGGAPCATIKSAGLPVTGWVSAGSGRIPLEQAFAAIDWTCGFFPYRTTWRWACAAGRDAAGRAFGMNLAQGVHEDPAGRHTENALWLEGRPAALPPVRFDVGRAAGEPWRVRSEDGAVDLEFRPEGERQADVDLGLVASRFRQPCGAWSGRLRDREGREAALEGAAGVVEDHAARW
jgi:hypothetical protein